METYEFKVAMLRDEAVDLLYLLEHVSADSLRTFTQRHGFQGLPADVRVLIRDRLDHLEYEEEADPDCTIEWDDEVSAKGRKQVQLKRFGYELWVDEELHVHVQLILRKVEDVFVELRKAWREEHPDEVLEKKEKDGLWGDAVRRYARGIEAQAELDRLKGLLSDKFYHAFVGQFLQRPSPAKGQPAKSGTKRTRQVRPRVRSRQSPTGLPGPKDMKEWNHAKLGCAHVDASSPAKVVLALLVSLDMPTQSRWKGWSNLSQAKIGEVCGIDQARVSKVIQELVDADLLRVEVYREGTSWHNRYLPIYAKLLKAHDSAMKVVTRKAS